MSSVDGVRRRKRGESRRRGARVRREVEARELGFTPPRLCYLQALVCRFIPRRASEYLTASSTRRSRPPTVRIGFRGAYRGLRCEPGGVETQIVVSKKTRNKLVLVSPHARGSRRTFEPRTGAHHRPVFRFLTPIRRLCLLAIYTQIKSTHPFGTAVSRYKTRLPNTTSSRGAERVF